MLFCTKDNAYLNENMWIFAVTPLAGVWIEIEFENMQLVGLIVTPLAAGQKHLLFYQNAVN